MLLEPPACTRGSKKNTPWTCAGSNKHSHKRPHTYHHDELSLLVTTGQTYEKIRAPHACGVVPAATVGVADGDGVAIASN